MSRKSKGDDSVETPVPRKPSGPLGPWRLSLALGVSTLFTGTALFDAAGSGIGIDMALLRSFGVAFLTWIAVGILNRVLAQVPGAADADADTDPASAG